jgi:hypothetical protein
MISTMATGSRWTNLRADGTISNDPAELAAMNENTTMWSPYTRSFTFTDWAVEDGSFLRLSTATIGYTLPQSISSKLKMRKTQLTPGVDYSAYPKSRSFVFGLNVNF